MRTILLTGCFLLSFVVGNTNSFADEFVLQDGERVLLIGNTLIEREQEYGAWEAQMTVAASPKKLTFRNLGWSADTVWGESRGMFDPPEVGYQRLLELVKELKPTTIFLGYGAVESQAGPAGLEKFKSQYLKLRQDLSATGARFIHVAPLFLEAAAYPTAATEVKQFVATANENIDLYAGVIQQIAAESGELFIDFRPEQRKKGQETLWTENGVHLSQAGYQATAKILVKALGGEPTSGDHSQLKKLIHRKNEQFFHRWRPQNFTYLFGFRKHEQGQNAVEIAEFDPIIEKLEKQITESLQAKQQ